MSLRFNLKILHQSFDCLGMCPRRAVARRAFTNWSCLQNSPGSNAHRFVVRENTNTPLPDEFFFQPDFLNAGEQITLLSAALKKLDSISSARKRRLRATRRQPSSQSRASGTPRDNGQDGIQVANLFHPDVEYEFEEVCRLSITIGVYSTVVKGSFRWGNPEFSRDAHNILATRRLTKTQSNIHSFALSHT